MTLRRDVKVDAHGIVTGRARTAAAAARAGAASAASTGGGGAARTLPAGTQLVISPMVLHRHPAHWEAPAETPRPERFTAEARAARADGSFLPFSAGAESRHTVHSPPSRAPPLGVHCSP